MINCVVELLNPFLCQRKVVLKHASLSTRISMVFSGVCGLRSLKNPFDHKPVIIQTKFIPNNCKTHFTSPCFFFRSFLPWRHFLLLDFILTYCVRKFHLRNLLLTGRLDKKCNAATFIELYLIYLITHWVVSVSWQGQIVLNTDELRKENEGELKSSVTPLYLHLLPQWLSGIHTNQAVFCPVASVIVCTGRVWCVHYCIPKVRDFYLSIMGLLNMEHWDLALSSFCSLHLRTCIVVSHCALLSSSGICGMSSRQNW